MKVQKLSKYIVIILILLVLDCALSGYIGFWRNWYWDSIEHKLFFKWMFYLLQFTSIALISCWVTGYSQYISNMATLLWRTRLTKTSLKKATYTAIEGGPQRVQEDCNKYPALLISLLTNGLKAVLMVVVYAYIIVSSLPLYYLFIPVGYSILGTILAGKIGYPLINLNYINQVFEARFRQLLTKINYSKVHRNNYNLYKRTKYLAYFQSFYSQISIIIPHVVLSFVYFSGKITFGIFMQIASSMAAITDSLSIIISSLNDINNFLSCRRRLKEIEVI